MPTSNTVKFNDCLASAILENLTSYKYTTAWKEYPITIDDAYDIKKKPSLDELFDEIQKQLKQILI